MSGKFAVTIPLADGKELEILVELQGATGLRAEHLKCAREIIEVVEQQLLKASIEENLE